MTYKLTSYTIHELGRRKHQEDALYPEHYKATSDDRLFILCDGTGDEKGDRASNTVCQALSKALLLHSTPEGAFTDAIMQQAVTSAYNALDAVGDIAGDKVGTTLAVIKFHEQGATVAYIGSSRIYHVRPASRKGPAQLLFRSNDPVEGEPALMMPRQRNRARVEIAHIQDIQPDDYFFIVSDGMLEFLDDERVVYNLTKPGVSDKDKVNIFLQATLDNKDNHSAHLIHVTRVKGHMAAAGGQAQGGGVGGQMTGFFSSLKEQLQNLDGRRPSARGYVVIGLFLVLFAAVVWAVWPTPKSSDTDDEMLPEPEAVDAPKDDNDSVETEVSVEDFGAVDDTTANSLKNDPGVGVESATPGTTPDATDATTTTGTTATTGTAATTTKAATTTTGAKKATATTKKTTGTTNRRTSATGTKRTTGTSATRKTTQTRTTKTTSRTATKATTTPAAGASSQTPSAAAPASSESAPAAPAAAPAGN